MYCPPDPVAPKIANNGKAVTPQLAFFRLLIRSLSPSNSALHRFDHPRHYRPCSVDRRQFLSSVDGRNASVELSSSLAYSIGCPPSVKKHKQKQTGEKERRYLAQ